MAEPRSFGFLPHPDYEHINWFGAEEQTRFEKLMGIPRFHLIPEMTQRTSVATHTIRVTIQTNFFSEALLETGVELDQPLLMFLADHHDDPELITGDYPTPVKRNATPEEKQRMEMEEDAAARALEWLINKPKWAQSFADIHSEYRKKGSFEARILNFLDKWDGLHEAVHEVVTGENKDGFRQVIRDYKPIFEELYEKNEDWIPKMEHFVESPVFHFPDPQTLTPKTPETLSYKSVDDLIDSLSIGNPESYRMWLRLNRYVFGGFFLEHTFPGWEGTFPPHVTREAEKAQQDQIMYGTSLYGSIIRDEMQRQFPHERKTASGLYIPAGASYKTFSDSLLENDMYEWIQQRGEEIRVETGAEKAEGIFYLRQ